MNQSNTLEPAWVLRALIKKQNNRALNWLLINSVHSTVALAELFINTRLYCTCESSGGHAMCLGGVRGREGFGHSLSACKLRKRWGSGLVCWICLWLWHESTNPPTRAGEGIIKTFELNKHCLQQKERSVKALCHFQLHVQGLKYIYKF